MVYGYLVAGARDIMADPGGYSYSTDFRSCSIAVYDSPRDVPIGGTRDPRHIITTDDVFARCS